MGNDNVTQYVLSTSNNLQTNTGKEGGVEKSTNGEEMRGMKELIPAQQKWILLNTYAEILSYTTGTTACIACHSLGREQPIWCDLWVISGVTDA